MYFSEIHFSEPQPQFSKYSQYTAKYFHPFQVHSFTTSEIKVIFLGSPCCPKATTCPRFITAAPGEAIPPLTSPSTYSQPTAITSSAPTRTFCHMSHIKNDPEIVLNFRSVVRWASAECWAPCWPSEIHVALKALPEKNYCQPHFSENCGGMVVVFLEIIECRVEAYWNTVTPRTIRGCRYDARVNGCPEVSVLSP